jgi:hypothetical protein
MRRAMNVLILGTSLTLLSVPAHPAPILYTDRTTWTIAVGSVTNIDFEGIAPAGGLTDFTGSGLDLLGWHFDSYGNGPSNGPNYLLVVDDTYPNLGCGYPCYDWDSGAVLHGPPANGFGFGATGPAGVVATFAAGATAAGTDIWSIFPDSQVFDVHVRLADASVTSFFDVLTPLGGPPSRGFVGFTSDTPIVEIRFEPNGLGTEGGGGGPYVDLDNFAFQPVPEPGSLLLLGTGLLGLRRTLRNRSRKTQG